MSVRPVTDNSEFESSPRLTKSAVSAISESPDNQPMAAKRTRLAARQGIAIRRLFARMTRDCRWTSHHRITPALNRENSAIRARVSRTTAANNPLQKNLHTLPAVFSVGGLKDIQKATA